MHVQQSINGRDDEEANGKRQTAQEWIDRANEAIKELWTFYDDITKDWATLASRVLGHVVFSPPISFSAGAVDKKYTEDYAVIKVDNNKIDMNHFKGNVIDLGTKIDPQEFTQMMYLDPKSATSFKYPKGRQLKLLGTISVEEMAHPTMRDPNGDPCLMVIKNGSTTGVTIGRANGIRSYQRIDVDGLDVGERISKEWAIIPYDNKSAAFSALGDSGAVVVDGRGRIGGLLTGGAGIIKSFDTSYATPAEFLLKGIKANGFPDVYISSS